MGIKEQSTKLLGRYIGVAKFWQSIVYMLYVVIHVQ